MNVRRLLQSRFAKDSAWLQASAALQAVSALASSVIVAKLIGDDEQGRYFTALSLYGFGFMMLGQGVVHASVSQLAQAIARDDADKAAGWIAFVAKSYALLGIVVAVGGYFLFPWLGDVIAHDHEIGVWAFWLAFSPLLELVRVVAYTTFQGARRMRELAMLEVAAEGCRLVAVSVGAWLTGSAVGPVVGTVIATGCGSVIGLHLFRRVGRGVGHKLPSPRLILARTREVPLGKGLALSFRVGALRSLDALAFNVLPPLVIQSAGRLAGAGDMSATVAHFRVVQRVLNVPITILQSLSRTALPALSGIAGRGDAKQFRRAFLRVTATGGLIMASGVACAVLVLPWVAPLWGDDYVEPMVRIGRILALGFALQGLAVAFDSFYILAQKLRVAILLSFGSMGMSLPAMYILTYLQPETGAAWGLVVCYSWVWVHIAYIARWFKGGGPERTFAARAATT